MTIKIAILLNGGLGSIVVGAEYVSRLKASFSDNIRITIFASPIPEINDCLFKDVNFIDEYHNYAPYTDSMKNDYDVVIEVVFFSYIHYISKDVPIPEDLDNYLQLMTKFQKSDEMSRVYSLGANTKPNIYRWGTLNGLNRLKIADPIRYLGITDEYTYHPILHKTCEEVLSKFNIPEKYITVQRGTNPQFSKESNRDWPIAYYEELITLLKKEYPDYKIVQLGESLDNCVTLNNVDYCLVGSTDLEDIKVLLTFSYLHIDGECGMVHLRKSLTSKPSIVFMGPAPADFFGYKGNINMESHPCGAYCHGLCKNWFSKCIAFTEPRCMTSILPKDVMAALNENKPTKSDNALEELLSSDIYLDPKWVNSWLKEQFIYAYYLQSIEVSQLKVRLFQDGEWKVCPITESPAFAFIKGNESEYVEYISYKNECINDGDTNTIARYKELIEKMDKGFNEKSYIAVDEEYVVLDGQHRACYLMGRNGLEYKVNVVKIYRKRD